MRIAAIEKMGYYPTPPLVTDLIARWLTLPSPEAFWRLLDPCCGRGEAAAQLAQTVGGECQTWGVELAPARAEAAGQVLSRVYNAAWQAVRVQEKSVSLLWLNPPYDNDYEGNDRRVELEFLRSALPSLVHGGILVYLVPQRILGYQAAARMLAGHFENLAVRRFPDGEYERFHQVVVLGVRKPYQTPTGEQVTAIRALADADLPPLGDPEAPWPLPIPPAPAAARFLRVDVPEREKIARAFALGWPQELLQSLQPRQERPFRPALPLKKGHVAMLMAAGLMGTLRLKDTDGRPLLVKGRVVKRVQESVQEDDRGQTVVVQKDRFITTVGVVSSDRVQVLDDVEGLTAFMEAHGDQVAAEILKNPPLYGLEPTQEEWATVSSLGRKRQPLPGQKEPGLLDVQKHIAIGLARTCRQHRVALIQGEMGVGKTTIALATIELMKAYPALVVCPPHLVPKWLREAQEVISGVRVRELRRIGKDGENGEVNDVRRFIEDYRNGLLGDRAIAVVASTSAKLGSGWDGAMATRYTLPRDRKDRLPFREALERYREACKALQGLKGSGADPESIEAQRRVVAQARRAALEAAIPYPVCPDCGQVQVEQQKEGEVTPLLDFRAFGRKPHTCNRLIPDSKPTEEDLKPEEEGRRDDRARNQRPCGAPLYSFGNGQFRRWPIADYIADHAPGFFQMLVCDEVHEMKAKDSDRGLAFHRLVNATRYHLALTGTFYGGKATSIFWLMHRLKMGNVHRDFAFNDERRWVERYGVLETRIYGRNDDDDETGQFGAFTAARRRRVVVQEKPGVSPAVLARIIECAIFVDLTDLGVALPPYREETALSNLARNPDYPEDQEFQYRRMDDTLKGLARQDPRYLSTWLQWSLSRPNSGFRDEEVVKEFRDEDGNLVMSQVILPLPAVVNGNGRRLPKEDWLVSFAQAEARVGRKVLVYVRQSGTRDIQPRLVELLRGAGLRADVLSASVDPRKREEWVEKRAWGLDALVVNPLLVQTGLDLVQFATVIFYEMQYSLYTLWQAMRRVWRLGQTQPVRVVFTAYRGTLEEQALALMGLKMRAAQLLYGQEVGGAIVPEDDGDFLQELARTVLEGRELPDLQTLFAAAHQESTSALGCPTAASPRLPRYTEEDLREMLEAERQKRAERARRRRKPVDPRQLELFSLEPFTFSL